MKKKFGGGFFSKGDFSWEGGGTLPQSYTVKENPISSAVSEILWHGQTNRQTFCYFIIRIMNYTLINHRGQARKIYSISMT